MTVTPPPPGALTGPHADEVTGTLVEQAGAISRGELSSRELTGMYLDRIEASDLNAFIRTRGDEVLAEAAALDERRAAGEPLGPLHGLPIAVKDNLFTAGTPTSGGAGVLRNFVPAGDAEVVRLLQSAGALVLGKTNLHEFSYGITSDNPHFGAVRNPYDPSRMPGGSSGGSGAAVAARLCSAAIGTDTGGSVRIPAALCGVVGFKPTLGLVSTEGLLGLSWNCDTIGPIARTVEDAALLLRVLSSSGSPAEVPLRGVRVGIPGGYFTDANSADVDRVLSETYKMLEEAGAILVPVTVAGVEQASQIGFLTVVPESVVLIRQALDDAGLEGGIAAHLDSFGPDVRSALASQVDPAVGGVLPAFAYAEAIARHLPALRRSFADALDGVDVLLTATTPTAAVPIEGSGTLEIFESFTRHTFCVSVAGLPAVSLPAGTDPGGLPIGVQLIGAPRSEDRLLDLALAFERALS